MRLILPESAALVRMSGGGQIGRCIFSAQLIGCLNYLWPQLLNCSTDVSSSTETWYKDDDSGDDSDDSSSTMPSRQGFVLLSPESRTPLADISPPSVRRMLPEHVCLDAADVDHVAVTVQQSQLNRGDFSAEINLCNSIIPPPESISKDSVEFLQKIIEAGRVQDVRPRLLDH